MAAMTDRTLEMRDGQIVEEHINRVNSNPL